MHGILSPEGHPGTFSAAHRPPPFSARGLSARCSASIFDQLSHGRGSTEFSAADFLYKFFSSVLPGVISGYTDVPLNTPTRKFVFLGDGLIDLFGQRAQAGCRPRPPVRCTAGDSGSPGNVLKIWPVSAGILLLSILNSSYPLCNPGRRKYAVCLARSAFSNSMIPNTA